MTVCCDYSKQYKYLLAQAAGLQRLSINVSGRFGRFLLPWQHVGWHGTEMATKTLVGSAAINAKFRFRVG